MAKDLLGLIMIGIGSVGSIIVLIIMAIQRRRANREFKQLTKPTEERHFEI